MFIWGASASKQDEEVEVEEVLSIKIRALVCSGWLMITLLR